MDPHAERQRIARDLWSHIRSFNTQNVRKYPPAARAIDAGADPADVVQAMTAASYQATFNALFVLTAEQDISALAASGSASALHEDLLTADPTGQEGQDLFR